MSKKSFFLKNSLLKFTILFSLLSFGFIYGTNETKPNFSFGIIADVQYSKEVSVGTRFYSNSLKKLSDAILDFNTRELSFVIQLGDLIDKDFESYDSVLSVFNKIKTDKYHVLGNHDYNVDEKNKVKILDEMGLVSSYYGFVSNGWRMIILNGNDLSSYAPKNSSEHTEESETFFQKIKDSAAINAQNWNGGLSSTQISWLQENLQQASLSGEKVILFCHFPVFPSRAENLWNDVDLITILESYDCVKAFFSGHYHAGNYAKKRGIHYLTFQGMVETEDQNAYSIIEVYSDHLQIRGFGREPNRILTFKEGNSQNASR